MPVGLYAGANVSNGNGVTVAFPYNFKILDQAHIEVKVDGVLKALGADYAVTGVGLSNGGNVVFLVAPANGTVVQRARKVPYKRDQDYQYNGDLREEVVDPDFDTIEMQVQQLAADTARAIKAPQSVTADQVVTDADWAARAGTVFGFDALGTLRLLAVQVGTSLVSLAAAAGSSLIGFINTGIGAVLRSVQSRLRDTVSVKDFGALGDGGTDDRAAIQAAIDAVALAGGGTIYFPPGNYALVSGGLTLPTKTKVAFKGAGRSATSLVVNANGVIVFSITGPAFQISITDMWIGSFAARVGTVGISVVGTSAAAPAYEIGLERLTIQNLNTPLSIVDVHRSHLDDIIIMQSVAGAITTTAATFVGAVGVSAKNFHIFPTAGKIGGDYVAVGGDCDTLQLEDFNCFGGCTGRGFSFAQGARTTGPRLTRLVNCFAENADLQGFYITAARDVRLQGCHAAVNGDSGFDVTAGDSINIQDCLALQNQRHGIVIEGGTGVRVMGCTASNNSQFLDNTYSGIRIENNTIGVRVIGNRSGDFIFPPGVLRQAYGISLGGGTNDNNVVVGNDLRTNQTAALGNFSAGTANVIDLNDGWVNRSKGTAVIASGTTAITVNHGLSAAPVAGNIAITPTNNPTADPGNMWVDTITATQFNINCRVNPGVSNLNVSWHAIVI